MSDRQPPQTPDSVIDETTPHGAPSDPDGLESSPLHLSASNTQRESSENYPAVVSMLDIKTRVIEGADGIQWVIQRRRGRQWHSQYFCRTKAGLLLYAGRTKPDEPPPPPPPELLALPDYFPE